MSRERLLCISCEREWPLDCQCSVEENERKLNELLADQMAENEKRQKMKNETSPDLH